MTIINGDDGLKCVELRYESLRKLQDELGPYLAGEGFFLKGETGLAPSDVLRFRIMLPGDFVLVEGVGVVIWIRTQGECGEEDAPGTALGFATLSEQGRELIERMAQTHQERGGRNFDLTRPSSEPLPPAIEETPEPTQRSKYKFEVRKESIPPSQMERSIETGAAGELPFPEENIEQDAHSFAEPTPESKLDLPPAAETSPEPTLEPALPEDTEMPEAPPAGEMEIVDDEIPPASTEVVELLPPVVEEEQVVMGPDMQEELVAESISERAEHLFLPPLEAVEEAPEATPAEESIKPELPGRTPPDGDSAPVRPPGGTPEPSAVNDIVVTPVEPEGDRTPRLSDETPQAREMEHVVMMPEDDEEPGPTLRVPSSPNLDVVIDDDGSIEVLTARRTRSRGYGKVLATVVVLAALGGGGWWLWQHFGETLMAGMQKEDSTAEATIDQVTPLPDDNAAPEAVGPGEQEQPVEAPTEAPADSIPAPTQAPQAQSTPQPAAPERTPAPRKEEAAATTGASATEILDVAWKTGTEGTRVRIRANGLLSAKRLGGGGLNSPPRYLLRINGIQVPFHPLEISVDSPELKMIRFGYHAETSPPSLWVVFDLRDPSVKMLKRSVEGQGVEILLGR